MPISRECKYFLAIHFIIGLIFGLIFLFIPDFIYDLLDWEDRDPVAIRILGVAFIGLSSGSLIAAFEDEWKEIRATMEMEVVFLLLGIITLIFCHIFLEFPITAWFIDVIMIILLAGFLFFILKTRSNP